MQTTTIVECADFNSLFKPDVHDVPYRLIGERTGALRNRGPDESETTALLREICLTYGSQKSIIATYDHFLMHKIPTKIMNTKMFIGNDVRIEFTNVRIMKPCMSHYQTKNVLTPRMARLKEQSYSSKIYVDINHIDTRTDETFNVEKDVDVFEIPVMLGSAACYTHGLTDGQKIQMGECPNDTQGYYIHNGSGKVFKNKETIRYNIPATYSEKNMFETRFICFSSTNVGTTLFIMRVYNDGKEYNGLFVVKLQHFDDKAKKMANVFSIFRLLGWSSEEAIRVILLFSNTTDQNQTKLEQLLRLSSGASNIVPDEGLTNYFSNMYRDKDKNKTQEDVVEDIKNALFSNMSSVTKKLYMLAFITSHTAMCILNIVSEDDRNSWSNKKYQTSANIIESSFNNIWSNMINNIEKGLVEANDDTYNVSQKTISHMFVPKDYKKIYEVFSPKGRNIGGRGKDTKPLSEQYKMATPIDGTSSITKSTAMTSNQNKKSEVRVINPSQILVACPAETPENAFIGVVKNLSITCWLALHHDGPTKELIETIIGESLYEEPYRFFSDDDDVPRKPLFVNGELFGFMATNKYKALRRLKYEGLIPFDSCTHFNPIHDSYEIFTTDTRPTAPLLIVENGKLVIDEKGLWGSDLETLLDEGCMEYMDAREIEYAKVAQSVNHVRNNKKEDRYTHSVIQANAMMGWSASITPWANKNKGPRVIYQASMSKQSLCAYSVVQVLSYDSTIKILNYAVRPLCESNTYQILGMESMPNSQNIIVAVNTRPDNNEDALEMKQEALNGQIFRVTKYVSIKITVENGNSSREILAKPTISAHQLADKYANIQDNGFPPIGTVIKRGDCLIGKLKSNTLGDITYNQYTEQYETSQGDKPVNVSRMAGIDEDGIVDRILVLESDGETIVRMRLKQYRQYEAGDKLALRYSQKGTIGKVSMAADMPTVIGGPFDGLIVDEFFSSLSLPSRMTASMPLEILFGLASLFTGKRVDCTTFEESDIYEATNILRKVGRERYNLEGEELEDFSNGLFRMARADGKIMGEHIINEDGVEEFVPSKVFIGPCSPQVLKHHVADKFQVRRKGPVNILTRQGISGRSRQGSLRFGEMESDAVKSSGAAYTLLERLKVVADEYNYVLCSCGADAISVAKTNTITCSENPEHGKNGDSHTFGVASITYISLLIKRLLAIASINLRFYPKITQ